MKKLSFQELIFKLQKYWQDVVTSRKPNKLSARGKSHWLPALTRFVCTWCFTSIQLRYEQCCNAVLCLKDLEIGWSFPTKLRSQRVLTSGHQDQREKSEQKVNWKRSMTKHIKFYRFITEMSKSCYSHLCQLPLSDDAPCLNKMLALIRTVIDLAIFESISR